MDVKLARWVVFCLVLTLTLTSVFKVEKSEAILPVAIAYGTLEVIMLSTTVAAAAGIITLQQSKAYQAQVNNLTHRLSESTGDAISTVSDQVKELYKSYTASLKKTGSVVRPTTPAKDADCKAGINDDPRKCCDQWFKKSENIENSSKLGFILSQVGKKAFQVFSLDGGSIRCCVEWDGTHARFEVYTPGGDGKYPGDSGDSYTHKGEFSCKNGEGDPCRASHPEKADQGGLHSPRQGCKNGLNHRSGGSTSPKPGVR